MQRGSKKLLNMIYFSLQELDKSAQDLVDFSPVYKCLYIFTVVVSDLCMISFNPFSSLNMEEIIEKQLNAYLFFL